MIATVFTFGQLLIAVDYRCRIFEIAVPHDHADGALSLASSAARSVQRRLASKRAR